MLEKLGLKIKNIREEKGMTIKELSIIYLPTYV